jgi:hypothetical protein
VMAWVTGAWHFGQARIWARSASRALIAPVSTCSGGSGRGVLVRLFRGTSVSPDHQCGGPGVVLRASHRRDLSRIPRTGLARGMRSC